MRFIQETGFSLKPTRNRAFQEWLIANQARLAACYPEGTSLVGVFTAVYSSEKEAGDVRLIEQLDSYGALDRIAAAVKDPESEYSKLISEFVSFFEHGTMTPWSSTLMKDVLDASVIDLKEDEAEARDLIGSNL